MILNGLENKFKKELILLSYYNVLQLCYYVLWSLYFVDYWNRALIVLLCILNKDLYKRAKMIDRFQQSEHTKSFWSYNKWETLLVTWFSIYF